MQAIFAQFMNGVSHMLVFVVAGGVLTAVSFSWGFTSFDSTAADYSSFAALLKIIGGSLFVLFKRTQYLAEKTK